MPDLVVVGVDGSETALTEAQTAARLATATGAGLHVLAAFDKQVRPRWRR
ncbi:universal stress protein [Rhodococcus sp. USK13]|nr:universal stress protein [Rhodococcus sp. USK13]